MANAVPGTSSPRELALRILGIRGVPARHGGFETFAERLALHLHARGWRITVYCQECGPGELWEDEWNGIRRVRIPVNREGALATVIFDLLAIRHAADAGEPCLTLGYNTALFCGWLRLRRLYNVINMDGLEWRRQKWGLIARSWFYVNDWAGCWLGNHLVADHPAIKAHLTSRVAGRKVTVIPYGADAIRDADADLVTALGLRPRRFLSLIARPEPENSVLEIVSAFSRAPRGLQLAVLGSYDPDGNPYHARVLAAASPEVMFLGPIYDAQTVKALRFHSAAYVHGHQVGGTNPSLVEALGAGNAILAHDNKFNRWVAGPEALYFTDITSCAEALEAMLAAPERLAAMAAASRARHMAAFQWEDVLRAYERLLAAAAASSDPSPALATVEQWQ